MNADPENIAMICLSARAIASHNGLSEEQLSAIELAISEAVTNSMEHAYKWDKKQLVKVEFGFVENCLEITVSDQGEAIPDNLLGNFQADSKAFEEDDMLTADSGRGLMLIGMLMDNISYSQSCGFNHLHMKKCT